MNDPIKILLDMLDLDITSINERQLLKLICLLGEENIIISPCNNEYDLAKQICQIYINKLETNGFIHLTEYKIIQSLAMV